MNKRIKVLILTFVFAFTIFQFKTTAGAYNGIQTYVGANNEWSINFNDVMNSSTINSNNIIVKDSSGNIIPAALNLSQDKANNKSTLLVTSQQGKIYTIYIGEGVKYSNGAYTGSLIFTNSNKEWTVEFNKPVDKKTIGSSTVNNSNITVEDSTGKNIPAALNLSQDNYKLFISPQISGYDPGATYTVNIGRGVKNLKGVPLSEAGTLKFTVVNNYSDGTSYSGLPTINSVSFKYPVLSGNNMGFILNSTSGQAIQYRIFAAPDNSSVDSPYSIEDNNFKDITGGYVSPDANGAVTANTALSSGTNGQKYRVIIYVKRAGVDTGAHKDMNTDYDNYYIDYFRCVSAQDVQNVIYKNYSTSLSYGVNKQMAWESQANSGPYFSKGADFTDLASANQVKYYMNPSNFLDSYGKYQFLKLSYTDGVTAADLNIFLDDKGIFKGLGQDFIDAAKANNISVAYLVSHAMLETGNGTSYLANQYKQVNYRGKTVYNFFGIGAVDSDPNGAGAQYAYNHGWFTPQLAISGGANWISQGYINSSYKQDTIYKMRWDPDNPGQHQYATDISWAYNQISDMIKIVQAAPSLYRTANFEVPKYAQ